jgi:hypothetical protein
MNTKPYRVHGVVDPLYGPRLCDLPADEPVWVIDTETNRPVPKKVGTINNGIEVVLLR